MRQSNQRQIMLNVCPLRFFAAEEFAAGRKVEKELSNFDRSARRATSHLHLENLAAMNNDLRSLRVFTLPFARRDRHAAHACDARNGFAPETHGGNRGEVLCLLYFACGVSLE